MTDIREAREVLIATKAKHRLRNTVCSCMAWNANLDQAPPFIHDQHEAHVVDEQIAALSEAGMTICGEQVGWRYRTWDDEEGWWPWVWSDAPPSDNENVQCVPVFVLSDPQPER